MSSLERFNSTLSEFEEQVNEFKEMSGVLSKIEQQIELYNTILSRFNNSAETLECISKSQEDNKKKLIESLDVIDARRRKGDDAVSSVIVDNMSKLNAENAKFNTILDTTLKLKFEEFELKYNKILKGVEVVKVLLWCALFVAVTSIGCICVMWFK